MSSLKAGALYFIVVFAAGRVFGPVRQLLIVPRVGAAIGVLLEAPLMLLAMILAARWTMRRLAVSPKLVAGPRGPYRSCSSFSSRRCPCSWSDSPVVERHGSRELLMAPSITLQ